MIIYPDKHDGVISHLEPDIPECEVKWALGPWPITMNKASGSDGIPVDPPVFLPGKFQGQRSLTGYSP